uniref:ATP synthase complex subunit 8 n=1 Tax=Bostrichoidea sp. 6 KM-2017 TaxID=2219280 RepID=A0A346RKE6_9COLE|nr:ATP synthase F0 subunit 8 [Bostrichoidea sp. 6 KM-2017]
MPQMSPLSWLTLFIYFLLIFIITCSINFYKFNYTYTKLINKNQFKTSWKW